MVKTLHKILIVLLLFLVTSCGAISTDNPKESYQHWTGDTPPQDMKVIEGHYWQSGHWTREYIVYLKLQPTKTWWTEFIRQNKLIADTIQWTQPGDAPKWFTPPSDCLKWKTGDDFQGSRYLSDTLTGNYYIYEIQL